MTHPTPAHRAAVYRREADLLFRSWKEKHARAGLDQTAGVFVRDGVVCPAQWFAQPVRPLFLLKEAYHGSRDWDLVQDHLLPMDRVRGRTWRRVALWTYGLLHTTAGRLCPFAEAAAETGDTLLRAMAVMNVKKRSGQTRSHMAEIRQYAAADRAELYRQLQLCDPTVLVCGYTISALGHILPGPAAERPRRSRRTQPGPVLFLPAERSSSAGAGLLAPGQPVPRPDELLWLAGDLSAGPGGRTLNNKVPRPAGRGTVCFLGGGGRSAGMEPGGQAVLQNLRAVDPALFCQVCHPRGERYVLSDGTGVGQGAIGDGINANEGKNGFRLADNGFLRGRRRDGQPLILGNDQPAGGGVGDLRKRIFDGIAGGHAARRSGILA